MATSGHGIKILNSVSKTHPESYIVKSYRKTLTLRLHRGENDTTCNVQNLQNNNFIIKTKRKQAGNKSLCNVELKSRDRYLTNLVAKSLGLLGHKDYVKNGRGTSYETIQVTQADYENHNKILPSFHSVICDRSQAPQLNENKHLLDGLIRERKSCQTSRSSISCEVLQIPEENRELEYTDDGLSFKLSHPKSTSSIPNTAVTYEKFFSSEEQNVNADNTLTIDGKKIIKKDLKKVKSESSIKHSSNEESKIPEETFYKVIKSYFDENSAQKLLQKPSLKSLKSTPVVILNKLNSQMKNQIRLYSAKNNDGKRSGKLSDTKEPFGKYGAYYHGQSQSPTDKWMKSSKSLLHHIKRHVQEKHRPTPILQSKDYQPKGSERNLDDSEKNNTEADDIKPLLTVISNAKQMAFEMKRLVKQPHFEEYATKESNTKSEILDHMTPQRKVNYVYGEQKSKSITTVKQYSDHCNKLLPNNKAVPITYDNKYSYLTRKQQKDVKFKTETNNTYQTLSKFYPVKSKSNLSTDSKIQNSNIIQGNDQEQVSSPKLVAPRELKNESSHKLFDKNKENIPKERNFLSNFEEKKLQDKMYKEMNDIPSNSYVFKSKDTNLWKKKQSNSLPNNQMSINSTAVERKPPSRDTEERDQEKQSKRMVSLFSRTEDKTHYINALKKIKITANKIDLVSGQPLPWQKQESRITPNSLLNTQVQKINATYDDLTRKTFNKNSNQLMNELLNKDSFFKSNKVTQAHKDMITNYFRERSSLEHNKIKQPDKDTHKPSEKQFMEKSLKYMSKSSTLPMSKAEEKSSTSRGEEKAFNQPIDYERDETNQNINQAKELENERVLHTLPESPSDSKLNYEDSFPSDSNHQSTKYKLMYGREYKRNEGFLRHFSFNPIWENSLSQPHILDSTEGQSYSVLDENDGFNKKYEFRKDKFARINTKKSQNVQRPFYSNYKISGSDIRTNNLGSDFNSPRSKSLPSFIKPTQNDAEYSFRTNDSKPERKNVDSYQEYKKKVAKKSSTPRLIESIMKDDGSINPQKSKGKGFMSYFMKEFQKTSESDLKKEGQDESQLFQKADFKMLSFNEPNNRLQPSELTIKLKKFSSVPEIRNDVTVNQSFTRINKTEKDDDRERTDEENILDYEVKQKNFLHNNILQPTEKKVTTPLKNKLSLFNVELKKFSKKVSDSWNYNSRSKLNKPATSESKDVKYISNSEKFDAVTQDSLYRPSPAETKTEGSRDFNKTYSTDTYTPEDTMNSRRYREKVLRKIYEKDSDLRYRYGRLPRKHQFDYTKVSSDEIDFSSTLPNNNYWFDELNNSGTLTHTPLNIKPSKKNRKHP